MFTREDRGTTGELVSRVTVLNCLAHNLVEENHLDPDVRRQVMAEARSLARTSPHASIEGHTVLKLHLRMAERCATGAFN